MQYLDDGYIVINTARLPTAKNRSHNQLMLDPFCFHITSFDFLSGLNVQCIFYILFCFYYFYIIDTVLFKLYFQPSFAITMLEMLLSCIESPLDNLLFAAFWQLYFSN